MTAEERARRDRARRSPACRGGEHAPVCQGYYPPGLDTYRCLCHCHISGTSTNED